MKITTDLTGNEAASVRQARLKAVYDWYKGAGAYVSAGNLGSVRAIFNDYLASDIANQETFASWLVKFNRLNSLDILIPPLIFAGGEQGFLFDPSSLANLYQDDAGATPVTAAGQSVGRMMDTSGRNNNATQATVGARPTYQIDGGGRPYLAFDGIDDWLGVGSVAMGAAGRTVISAVRKNSDSSLGAIVETRPLWTTAGGVAQYSPGGSGPNYGSRIQTTAVQSSLTSPDSFAAPYTAVVSSVFSTGSQALRVNGISVATATPTGVSSALTSGFAIGSRDGTTFFANMRLYGLIVIDRALTANELAVVENWAATRCGVTL